jgi:hypothetical protein
MQGAVLLIRRLLALGLGALVLLWPAHAGAHEEISPATVPTGKPVFLTVSAANERRVDLTKLTLTAPQGLTFGGTSREPSGWTAARTASVITWTGGAVPPGRFEQWGFELEAIDQPGAPSFRVSAEFADGFADTHQVLLTVAADTGSPASPTTTAQTPATTAAAPATTSAAPATTAADVDGGGGGARTLATASLVVALAALVLSVISIARSRKGSSGPDASDAPEQDW